MPRPLLALAAPIVLLRLLRRFGRPAVSRHASAPRVAPPLPTDPAPTPVRSETAALAAPPVPMPAKSNKRLRGSCAQPLKVRNKAEAAALPPPAPNSVLTEEQAAMFLNLSKFTLLRLRHDRTGPPWVQIGKRRVGYLRADIETWLASQEIQP